MRWVRIVGYPISWIVHRPLDFSVVLEPPEPSEHDRAHPLYLIMDVIKP